MCVNISGEGVRKVFSLAAACFAVFGMLAFGPSAAEAPAEAIQKATVGRTLSLSDLEEGFWACDYVATTRGVGAAPVALCTAITEELKQQKFGGDFLELLAWWRQNKLATHAKLEGER